ncbi:MAG TPA: HlyD family efflux transporter periplasmic adaptor subunit [Thermoanaerobaculia bacterium]|nr:HlyD family efflux transporter periplasmic adaptor subunit [Thermoanaerobaculia bacterium]
MRAFRLAAAVPPLLVLSMTLMLPACRGAGAQPSAGDRSASGRGRPATAMSGGAGRVEELVVRRGTLRRRLVLSGQLVAARAEALVVPQTPSFQVQIRWMAEEGSQVAAGQPAVELDNSTFTAQLEEKRLAAAQAASELAGKQAAGETAAAEKSFTVEQKKAALAKARIAAAVPRELVPLRTFQDHMLERERAEAELAKAEEDLAASRRATAADLGVQRVALDKSRREIDAAERAIASLTLRAPRDGMVLIADHPWEGRKVRVGDNVFVGMTVATLPDLSSMVVEASLSDVDDGRIAPGMAAVCVLDAHPRLAFPGRVVEISPVARESARSSLLRYFPVRVALDRRDPRLMRPGMSVRVAVEGPRARDALLVPRAALDLAADPPRALLAEGGTVAVRLGPCAASECVAESGVRPGQRLRARREGRGI